MLYKYKHCDKQPERLKLLIYIQLSNKFIVWLYDLVDIDVFADTPFTAYRRAWRSASSSSSSATPATSWPRWRGKSIRCPRSSCQTRCSTLRAARYPGIQRRRLHRRQALLQSLSYLINLAPTFHHHGILPVPNQISTRKDCSTPNCQFAQCFYKDRIQKNQTSEDLVRIAGLRITESMSHSNTQFSCDIIQDLEL